jgi:hypothetical protein
LPEVIHHRKAPHASLVGRASDLGQIGREAISAARPCVVDYLKSSLHQKAPITVRDTVVKVSGAKPG